MRESVIRRVASQVVPVDLEPRSVCLQALRAQLRYCLALGSTKEHVSDLGVHWCFILIRRVGFATVGVFPRVLIQVVPGALLLPHSLLVAVPIIRTYLAAVQPHLREASICRPVSTTNEWPSTKVSEFFVQSTAGGWPMARYAFAGGHSIWCWLDLRQIQ